LRSGEYYSRGKLLLSGEYLVLYGAKALTVPLKFGQHMLVTEMPGPGILKWETFVLDKLWFSAVFRLKDLVILEFSDETVALFIQNLLKEGSELQPVLPLSTRGYHIQNKIDFDINWGLGSSSSLVSNLAAWLDIDLYTFYKRVFQGSGYDVFCSRADSPVTFQLQGNYPQVIKTFLTQSITDHLYFIYSGKKQDSQESVRRFKEQHFKDDQTIRKVTDLTDAMINAGTSAEFLTLMRLHEEALSDILGLPMVKEKLFPDFDGEIKSLGAWGGDFIMAGSSMKSEEVKDYFSKRNLQVVYPWAEIIY
jgi:mevalonate kinase